MSLDVEPLRVKPGEDLRLADRPTRAPASYASKSNYRSLLEARVHTIARLQGALYAERRSALLVILQSPDAGG